MEIKIDYSKCCWNLPVGYPDPSEKLKKKELIDRKERLHLEK